MCLEALKIYCVMPSTDVMMIHHAGNVIQRLIILGYLTSEDVSSGRGCQVWAGWYLYDLKQGKTQMVNAHSHPGTVLTFMGECWPPTPTVTQL